MNQAPALSLQRLDDPSGSPVTLAGMLKSGPVVLAFFKISCPVCQLAFPFLERLHSQASGLQFAGVSQDDAGPSKEFVKRYGVGFPILLDRAQDGYPASNAYRLTHVPTVFVIEPDGAISHTWSGFSRADVEKLALRTGSPVFRDTDNVPAWKAG